MEDAGTGFRIEPPRVSKQNDFEHSTSMIHPSAVAGLSLNKNAGSSRNNPELRAQKSNMSRSGETSSSSLKKNEKAPPSRDSSMVKYHTFISILTPSISSYMVFYPSFHLVDLWCCCVLDRLTKMETLVSGGVCSQENQNPLFWTIDASWGQHGRNTQRAR